jgi:hypothetical protein
MVQTYGQWITHPHLFFCGIHRTVSRILLILSFAAVVLIWVSPAADLWTFRAERLGYRVISWNSRCHSHREEHQHFSILEARPARNSQSRQGRDTSICCAQWKPHMTGLQSLSMHIVSVAKSYRPCIIVPLPTVNPLSNMIPDRWGIERDVAV